MTSYCYAFTTDKVRNTPAQTVFAVYSELMLKRISLIAVSVFLVGTIPALATTSLLFSHVKADNYVSDITITEQINHPVIRNHRPEGIDITVCVPAFAHVGMFSVDKQGCTPAYAETVSAPWIYFADFAPYSGTTIGLVKNNHILATVIVKSDSLTIRKTYTLVVHQDLTTF